VHRLLVDEQQDGGADVAATGAPAAVASARTAGGVLVGRLVRSSAAAAGMVAAAPDALAGFVNGVQGFLLDVVTMTLTIYL